MAATSMTKFECAICMEDVEEVPNMIGGAAICGTCTKTPLKAAFIDEAAYPPSLFGDTTLDINDYTHLFPAELVVAYQAKEVEYGIAYKHRAYCSGHVSTDRCNCVFDSTVSPINTCTKCGMRTCACGGVVNQGIGHDCEDKPEDTPPSGVRGESWQRCLHPDCGIYVVHRDGCNEMTCAIFAYRTKYCFVCGVPTAGNIGHWTRGGCPRWPDTGSEMDRYDVVPTDVDALREAAFVLEDRRQAGTITAQEANILNLPAVQEILEYERQLPDAGDDQGEETVGVIQEVSTDQESEHVPTSPGLQAALTMIADDRQRLSNELENVFMLMQERGRSEWVEDVLELISLLGNAITIYTNEAMGVTGTTSEQMNMAQSILASLRQVTYASLAQLPELLVVVNHYFAVLKSAWSEMQTD